MPGHNELDPPANSTEAGRPAPPRLSRRSVLRGAAGAGAAGIAATAFASSALPAFAAANRTAEPAGSAAKAGIKDADTTEPVVVHVRDAGSGEIDVFRGTSQTRVHDRELAARLVRASR